MELNCPYRDHNRVKVDDARDDRDGGASDEIDVSDDREYDEFNCSILERKNKRLTGRSRPGNLTIHGGE